jgi:hypothetical protein
MVIPVDVRLLGIIAWGEVIVAPIGKPFYRRDAKVALKISINFVRSVFPIPTIA